MKYEKPEVTAIESAVDAIQSSMVKRQQITLESFAPYNLATTSAYEADE